MSINNDNDDDLQKVTGEGDLALQTGVSEYYEDELC